MLKETLYLVRIHGYQHKVMTLLYKGVVSAAVPAYEDYEHLLHHPLIMLEQLIVNMQVLRGPRGVIVNMQVLGGPRGA